MRAPFLLLQPRLLVLAGLTLAAAARAQSPAWSEADTRAILDETLTLTLSPDLAHLTEGERTAVAKLLEAGALFEALYQDQRHPDAAAARATLTPGSPEATLFRLFQGPIATTPDNQRRPFLDVRPETPGKNVYPDGVTREELDAYLEAHPDAADDLLALRTVVRRATTEHLDADLATLDAHPGLALLHPGLREHLESLRRDPSGDVFYAVPYAVAYADRLLRIRTLLLEAADAVAAEDGDLAAYLRLRATDLLTGNYEGGDAAWVSGQFGNLNAQIGSYETYDDALYGVKAFYSLSLLARDEARSARLAEALTDIQAIENSLPYDRPKRVRSQIPVGVYHVVADFGQARGTNTATILPNEADHARKYGRTILLRYNIMTELVLFEQAHARYCAAVAEAHCGDLTLEGNFQRTLWHEIGHYLGVDQTADGRDLGPALSPFADHFEEMKADLVSLFAAEALHDAGYYNAEALRSVYASGILRVLQPRPPRRDQPYQIMQLMQWNYFLENGLLAMDPATGRLAIHYDRYHDVVASLLREVLALQSAGDVARAEAFVDRWTTWDEAVHGRVAEALRSTPAATYRLVRYGALGE
jgi:hypothetical protein